MQAAIKGYDLQESFGARITAGMDQFMLYGTAKATVEHDFPEVDGIDKDLPPVKIEARKFTVTFTLIAQGRDDFMLKYWGFRTVLKSSGLLDFYYAGYDKTYYVRYIDQQNYKQLTPSLTSIPCGAQFQIIFEETDPNANIEDVYIITEDDDYLIA